MKHKGAYSSTEMIHDQPGITKNDGETAMITFSRQSVHFSARRTGLFARFAAMMGLRRQRARLVHLDAHLLHDIGITAEEARTEATRPAWDVPAHWRK
jgi:uncharacterized protein YjiS (DUF1127 family)